MRQMVEQQLCRSANQFAGKPFVIQMHGWSSAKAGNRHENLLFPMSWRFAIEGYILLAAAED
jgi:hypothetical protein